MELTEPRYFHPNLKQLSHSSEQLLGNCARKYQLYKLCSPKREETHHTAFGTAVGDGVQRLVETGSMNAALFKAFLSWKGEFEEGYGTKDKKSAWFVPIALMAFQTMQETVLKGWEIAVFNGRPAQELTFRVDFGDGFFYRGAVDCVLYHPVKQLYLVLELKTTKNPVDEATYSNSMQGLGYGIIVDAIAKQAGAGNLSSYDVLYCVYNTFDFSWEALPFKKSVLKRLQWVQQVMLLTDVLRLYHSHNYWPINGSNCHNFGRRCEFYGMCNLNVLSLAGVRKLEDIKHVDEDKAYDFEISALQLLEAQVVSEDTETANDVDLRRDSDLSGEILL